jgi:hypothetical protein
VEQIINHSDPSFFEEINYLQAQRLAAQSSYEGVLEMLLEKLEGHVKVNTDIGLLLAYGKEAFDEQTMTSSSIEYLRNLGHTSSKVLAILEKLRYELRLLYDEHFENQYLALIGFIDFVVQSWNKLKEIEAVYAADLKYLMN